MAAMQPLSSPQSTDTATLVEHILARFHDAHRRDLPALVAQAQALQASVDGADPGDLAALRALPTRLQALASGLELHMFKEEMRLFPMMEQGGNTLMVHLIQDLGEEHARHDAEVAALHADARQVLARVAAGAPTGAGPQVQAQALLSLLDRFVDDLAQHMHIEDDVLFARYRPAQPG